MSSSIAERLAAERRNRFVGREPEVELFSSALTVDPPPINILYVFGPGGVGKTTLLREFVYVAEQAQASVIEIDGRQVAPTPVVFQEIVAQGLPPNPSPAGSAPPRTVLIVDSYERLHALDNWLRESFLPQLPGHMIIVLAGRLPPAPAWRADPGWRAILQIVPLRNLAPEASRAYLRKQHIPDNQHAFILSFTFGHPLALSLVAESYAQQPDNVEFQLEEAPDIVRTLLEKFSQNVPTPAHRIALEACALVSTLTEPLLVTMLETDEEQGRELFDWLRHLSFIDAGRFGIYPHDLAREVVAVDLRWRNLQQYERLHQKAREYYQQQIDKHTGQEQRQIIFDYVFLHRNNPIVRPYFEWESSDIYSDVFYPADLETILEKIQAHEGEEMAAVANLWLQHQPEGVEIFRNSSGELQGLLVKVALEKTTQAERRQDPAIAAAWTYLERSSPLRPNEQATYFRFWMAVDSYQSVSSTQSAIFLNMVQHYLTTPGLAFTFIPCATPDFWTDIFYHVDLHRLPEVDFKVEDTQYGVFGHDWRTVPPMAWLAAMAERELATSIKPEPRVVVEPLIVLSEEEFTTAVREALRHFNSPRTLAANALLKSRLVVERTLPETDRAPRVEALQSLLLESVNSLQQTPRQQKQYRALYHTYIRPAPSQEKAAELLDLPFSTYRRHLRLAIEIVTGILWQKELNELT